VGAACVRAGELRYVLAMHLADDPNVVVFDGLYFASLTDLDTNVSQCDEKRPTCGNCKKSGRDCPGYPDEFDLVFRDENKAMARKAKKTSASGPSRSSTGASSSYTSPHL
jgi:hypothetical protein